jgi:signal transduction histidine kinase
LLMIFRLADLRHAAEPVRRHGAIVTLATIVIIGFAATATLGTIDLRRSAARGASQTAASAVERVQAMLGRQQHNLDQLALIAATASDAAAQQLLDEIPALAPGIRGAAISDPTGAVQLRSSGEFDETVLSALSTDAAREAVIHADAATVVTKTLRDGDGGTALVGLARPWRKTSGDLAGIALVVVDRSAFAQFDLLRSDGSPAFDDGGEIGAKRVALGDVPLMLSYDPMVTGFRAPHGAWPLIAMAVACVVGALSLPALLVGQLNGARRAAALQAANVGDLREELAAAAAAAARIEELNRTKSQFFAQVTHELRTPLNAILGFSETIRQEMFGPVANPRYLEYAGLIHDAGNHLLSLINDLLDNARIEAGKMEISPIRVAAPALARSALDLVELLAEERDIRTTTTGLTTCPDLNIDPRAMKQVLVNLLSNSIKYTPVGGRIDVRFATSDDGGAAIEIADTGIGMSEEDLRVAFEPFARADVIEARRQQGTGLGLLLARALARLHGGDLVLTSRLHHGTTATIILPASAVFHPANAAIGATSAKAA